MGDRIASDRPWRVLVVDDYPLGRKLAALKLEEAGFVVHAVPTAEEAIELAKQSAPDAILSDIRMTGMNGFQLCEAVRSDPRLAQIPVLLLSSAIGPGEQARAQALGTVCLVRTADLQQVVSALTTTLRDRQRPA